MADIGWRRRRGSSPAAPTGARQRAGLTPLPPPTHFHASGRRFTHNSSGQSKNPLTAITVSTANPKRLTATANRPILDPDERSLQIDLVRLDRTIPAARCLGSRDPSPSTPTQCAAAQI